MYFNKEKYKVSISYLSDNNTGQHFKLKYSVI